MRPRAAVFSVGNEVLKGSVVNSNAAFLGRELTAAGFEVIAHAVCTDSEESIRFQLGDLTRRADLIVMCGGLGPTPDDVTREGIAAFFNVPLVFFKDQFARIVKLYRRFGKSVPPLVRREALYPANAKPLVNRFGVALGFAVEQSGKVLVALPGVPAELENMYADVVLPFLKKRFPAAAPSRRLVVRMTGISEPDVMERLGKGLFEDPFDFGIYPSAGEVVLRIYSESPGVHARLKKRIGARLRDFIYSWEERPLGFVIGELLRKKKRTLAVAESCTGGLLAAEIVSQPGSSRFFRGGTIAYHHEIKEKLGVDPALITRHGEVSAAVAGALASSVKDRMKTSYGLGITGIAGPSGGTPKKPVGLVYIGLAGPSGRVNVWQHHFGGDRGQVCRRTVVKALEYLWRAVR
ncbi:MAG: putative competence-damage inducible protein [Candidatus Omnitrophica bacterium ADurb.Bin314]|jgi:nicotinamide-nucleotide amidase|nr:MAG: putative competence-damage inducible protein [Candidatus Omnitrophica bacterium ADurb.Bin314]HOE69350.1 CinA family nicotinamide mononucleotide deamidase-related protein [Candidatus Omnitrophota bacterium]